jgi:hypothetical protein
MKGGLDRLIARVAHGQQEVRPRAPTMFEADGAAGDWGGEQIGEIVAEVREPGQPSASTEPFEARDVSSGPAGMPDSSGRAVPSPSEPPRQAKAHSVEQRSELRDLTPRLERRAAMDRPTAEELPARGRPASLPMSLPQQHQQPQALVEMVENNSIVIEIGRIEVKAPPTASPSSPAPSPQRRTARLTLDTYLSERRAAKR